MAGEMFVRGGGSKSGKEKHININKFAGLSRDWVGPKNLFMCFFLVIPHGGEKHINKIPPKIPGQSREKFIYVFFSLCVFFAPNQNGRKMAGEMAGQPKFGDVLPFRPFPRPFLGHFLGKPPLTNGRRPFRRPFLGHFWFWARFPFCSRPAKSQAFPSDRLHCTRNLKDEECKCKRRFLTLIPQQLKSVSVIRSSPQ